MPPRGCSAAPVPRTQPPREREPLGVPWGTGTGLSPSFPLTGNAAAWGTGTGTLGPWGRWGGRIWGPGRCPQGRGDEVVALTAPVESCSSANSLGSTAVRDASCGDRRLSPMGGTRRGTGGDTDTVTPSSGGGVPYLRLLLRLRLALPHGCRGALPMQEAAEKRGEKWGQNNSGTGKWGRRPQMGRFRPD